MQAKRLCPAAHTIFRGRDCQLVDHHLHRALLPVGLQHKRLDRQTFRGAPRHHSSISPDAVLCVSKAEAEQSGSRDHGG